MRSGSILHPGPAPSDLLHASNAFSYAKSLLLFPAARPAASDRLCIRRRIQLIAHQSWQRQQTVDLRGMHHPPDPSLTPTLRIGTRIRAAIATHVSTTSPPSLIAAQRRCMSDEREVRESECSAVASGNQRIVLISRLHVVKRQTEMSVGKEEESR